MDLGLDDYSDSDSSPTIKPTKNNKPNNTSDGDDDDDMKNFTIRTKSTAPKVVLNVVPQSHITQIKQQHQQQQEQQQQPLLAPFGNTIVNTGNGRPIVEKCYIDASEFQQRYHESKKESGKMLKAHEEKRRHYLLLKEKSNKALELTAEERKAAADAGFESDYSDEDDRKDHKNKTTDAHSVMKSILDDDESAKQSTKRRHINLDAESDDFTGSWGAYDGEKEIKDQVAALKQQKRQKLQESAFDQYGQEIDKEEQNKIIREKKQLTTKEVSVYHGTAPGGDGKMAKTESFSSQYVDFEYNTPEYLYKVLPNQQKYVNNKACDPEDVEKIKRDEELKANIQRIDPSTLPYRCMDSYHDILLTTAFKTSSSSSANDDKNVSPKEKKEIKNKDDVDLLRSFLDPPQGTKIDRTPALLSGLELDIQEPKLKRTPYLEVKPVKNHGGSDNGWGDATDKGKNTTPGVSLLKFFPYTNQYIATGHIDGSVRLYSTNKAQFNDKTQTLNGCVRSYQGHDRGLTHFNWVDDGRRFLTCSHDGWMKLWDTETGKVIYRKNTTAGEFKGNATPICAIMSGGSGENNNQNNNKNNQQEVIVGCGDSHIRSYDFRTNADVMEYQQMQASITTLIEVPTHSPRQSFMVAAADGQIFVFQNGIPSVFQHVMHHGRQMITRACLHPSEQFIIANTHTNTAAIFKIDGAEGKVKLNKNKKFDGHHTVGHQLGLSCSPDGKYLISGDGDGKVMCWSFNKGTKISSERLFTSVTSDVDWAWNSPMFAAASWDGGVKIFSQ